MYQTIFSAHPGLVAKNKHILNLCLAGKKIHTSIRKNEGGTKNLLLPYDIQLKMFMSFLKKTHFNTNKFSIQKTIQMTYNEIVRLAFEGLIIKLILKVI